MLKVVLDTNIFISAALISQGAPAKIIDAWEKSKFWLIVSASIIDEFRTVIFYDRIRKRCPKNDQEINEFIKKVQKSGIETPGKLNLLVIEKDPTDDKFIIAALEGNADYIVSGDLHLLELGSYENIKIVSPKEFVEILEVQKN